jgi:hypothetical protein
MVIQMYVLRGMGNGFLWRSASQDPPHVEKYLKVGKAILIPPIETGKAIKVWGEKEL